MVAQRPAGVDTSDPTCGAQVLVPFRGEVTGEAELSWGQRELWDVMREMKTWLPIGDALPVPAGLTVDRAIADLRFVMSRYPSMRTRLRLDPDGPKQVVAAEGELPLEIVDAADDADPAEVAEQVRKRYWKRDHDFVSDWPLRMAVVRHRGVLTHRVWVMCHLVTDGTGARVILQELADRDGAGRNATLSALDQAGWQGSPAGQRQCQAALRYWEKLLRTVPIDRFPARTELPYPRYWQGKSDSPALHLAVRAISARTGVEGTSVLLGLFAVALARVTGINPVVLVLVVSNRFRPGLARTVSPIIQNGLFALAVPDATVDEAVALARRRAMTAYKYAYYDPVRREEVIERVNRERGREVDLACAFNDRRLRTMDHTGPVPTPAEIRAAVPLGTFYWQYKQDYQPFDKLFVNLDDRDDTVAMTVTSDIHFAAPADTERCIRGMEEVAVAAALDPTTRTGVPGGGGGSG